MIKKNLNQYFSNLFFGKKNWKNRTLFFPLFIPLFLKTYVDIQYYQT